MTKADVTKHAAALTKAELNYKSDLNWLTYSCLLDFARYLKVDALVRTPFSNRAGFCRIGGSSGHRKAAKVTAIGT